MRRMWGRGVYRATGIGRGGCLHGVAPVERAGRGRRGGGRVAVSARWTGRVSGRMWGRQIGGVAVAGDAIASKDAVEVRVGERTDSWAKDAA